VALCDHLKRKHCKACLFGPAAEGAAARNRREFETRTLGPAAPAKIW
jgi:hypothetical protein